MTPYSRTNSPFLHIDFVVDGVRYAFSSGTDSDAKALQIEARARAEAVRRSKPSRGKRDMTFDEAAFRYWDDQGQSTRDADNLMGNLRRTVLMVGADTMCSWIDFDAMLGYRRELRKGLPELVAEDGPPAEPFKPKTINKYIGLVITVLNHAQAVLGVKFPSKPKLTQKDGDGVKLREPTNPRSRYLKKAEEDRLELACADQPDLMQMWKADLELGLRASNLCGARWDEYDSDARILTVYIKDPGKEPRPHEVYVTDEALEIFKQREGIHPEFIFTLPRRHDGWLDEQLSKKGEQIPVSRRLFYTRMKEAFETADIKKFIVHDLRRTAARREYLRKDIYAAMVFLGHLNIDTTADYIGLGPKELAEARRRAYEAAAKTA
jgi:integrase